jgi:hypothetical protein
MKPFQSIQDPLGNTIIVTSDYFNTNMSLALPEIKEIIATPAFIIQVENASLYYFKLIHSGLNMMIEVITKDKEYFISRCMENPSIEFISGLLKNGIISSFAH